MRGVTDLDQFLVILKKLMIPVLFMIPIDCSTTVLSPATFKSNLIPCIDGWNSWICEQHGGPRDIPLDISSNDCLESRTVMRTEQYHACDERAPWNPRSKLPHCFHHLFSRYSRKRYRATKAIFEIPVLSIYPVPNRAREAAVIHRPVPT